MTVTATVEAPAEKAIRNALRGVIDPELGDNVVDLGMVQRIDIDTANRVAITVALTTAGCPLAEPDSPAAAAFALLADRIVTETIPPVELAVCSIRQVLTEVGADLESGIDRLNQAESL